MNFLSKAILKLRDPIAYKHYKFLKGLEGVEAPHLGELNQPSVHFKHSGNAGDIIYAIPAMLAIAKDAGIHLHLNINQKGFYGKMHHPLGNLMLNEKTVNLLQPLLLSQPRFKACDVLTSQNVDVDLDKIRAYPLLLDRGNIARWYFLAHAVTFDLSRPWLTVTPDASLTDALVIARSHRYQAPGIDYGFLKRYSNLYFVGLPDEYELMKQTLPHIQYRPVSHFLEMAQVIAGCKLFIGNQSFPFALAEAMKVKRLLEVYFRSPNVSVTGTNGYDFCFQPQFERLVQVLYEKNEIR